ncbi:MAG: hypothetical protein Kow00129_06730 [Thermoleophilia bacterium]
MAGVFEKHSETPGHLPVGPKVTQQGKIDAPAVLCKGLVGSNAVAANAQNLGIQLLEPGQVGLQDRELAGSDWGPVQRIEEDDDILPLAGDFREPHVVAEMGRKCEIRRFFALGYWAVHRISSQESRS